MLFNSYCDTTARVINIVVDLRPQGPTQREFARRRSYSQASATCNGGYGKVLAQPLRTQLAKVLRRTDGTH